jgi:hypothetical protein
MKFAAGYPTGNKIRPGGPYQVGDIVGSDPEPRAMSGGFEPKPGGGWSSDTDPPGATAALAMAMQLAAAGVPREALELVIVVLSRALDGLAPGASLPAGGAATLATLGMAAGAAPAVSCQEVVGHPVLGKVAGTLQISAG